MTAALLKVAIAGLTADRAVGVGDPVPLAVLLDAGDRLSPGPPSLDGGGRLPKLLQPTGPLQLDFAGVDAAAPG